MKSFLPKILFFYSAIASLFIAASLTLTSKSITPIVFAVFFLPVAAYFITELFNQIRSKSDTTIAPQKGQSIMLVIVFLILLGVGLRNIYTKSSAVAAPTTPPEATSAPLIFKINPSPTPESSTSAQVKEVAP